MAADATEPRSGRWRTPDAGTPADPRFSLANERTFLAWNRTALALVVAGLVTSQFVHGPEERPNVWLGVTLILEGAIAGATGFARWRMAELALRRRLPLPRSRLAPVVLGAGILSIAIGCSVFLVLRSTHI